MRKARVAVVFTFGLLAIALVGMFSSMTNAGANRVCATVSATAPVIGGRMVANCAPILPTTFNHPVTVKQCQGSDVVPVTACATVMVDLP